ncbi:MAG: ROK family transcriptional regulator [Thiolinea sp.]
MNKVTQRQDGGSNLTGIAQYNERLILQHIRRSGSLPKAEIARITRLSAQTASVIINRLLDRKLVRKQSQRISTGKVGQPAIPIELNPDGAFSLGVKIGRRGLDIMLVNFVGDILQSISHSYDFPDPEFVFPAIEKGLSELKNSLSKVKQKRILGIGIAAPYSLGGWQQEEHIPPDVTTQWNIIDIKKRVQETQEHTVWLVNDATAACIASLELGNPGRLNNYLYLFIGTFVGGGIIINRSFYNGSFNNAGAIGSMPLPRHYAMVPSQQDDNRPVQFINCASRYALNDQLEALGAETDKVLEIFATQGKDKVEPAHAEVIGDWLQSVAPAIAYAITAAISVIDFEGVIIDGLLPAALTRELTEKTEQEMQHLNLEGLNTPQLFAGDMGNEARALGGAFLPFYTNFSPDRSILISSESNSFDGF